jgi:hypothetical protein
MSESSSPGFWEQAGKDFHKRMLELLKTHKPRLAKYKRIKK